MPTFRFTQDEFGKLYGGNRRDTNRKNTQRLESFDENDFISALKMFYIYVRKVIMCAYRIKQRQIPAKRLSGAKHHI